MTTAHSVPVFESTVQKSRQWLHEICQEAAGMTDQQAYSLLRATLITLRDRLTVDEAAQFSAQLPLLLRGAFFEGWDPSGAPSGERNLDEFIERIREHMGPPNNTGLGDDLLRAVSVACAVIARHVSPGEVSDVVAGLPHDVGFLFRSH